MPEFNKTYTYGKGYSYYTVKEEDGRVSVVTDGRLITSKYALRFHLQEVTGAIGFRYV